MSGPPLLYDTTENRRETVAGRTIGDLRHGERPRQPLTRSG